MSIKVVFSKGGQADFISLIGRLHPFRHRMFLDSLSEAKTVSFVLAATQLCHNDTQLAHTVWCRLFPRIWNSFADRQQTVRFDVVILIIKIELMICGLSSCGH